MGLLEILDEMSKEEGFQGAGKCCDFNLLCTSYMETNGRKILLNENLLDYEKIILENPELFLGFEYGVIHEKKHKERAKPYFCFSHYISAIQDRKKEEYEIVDKFAVEELKNRGKDVVKAFAYDLVLFSLTFMGQNKELGYRLETLNPSQRKKAIKLYRNKMEDLASRYPDIMPINHVREYIDKLRD